MTKYKGDDGRTWLVGDDDGGAAAQRYLREQRESRAELLSDEIATAILNAKYAEAADQADDVTDTLRCLSLLAGTVESATRTAVTVARDAGVSWADIGLTLGVSRQAAWERFGRTAT